MPAACKHNRNADWCEACTIEYQSEKLKRYEAALEKMAEILPIGHRERECFEIIQTVLGRKAP